MKHIVNISGGKDSAATRLVAIERGIEHIAVFADTGNEHQQTYDWLDYFEQKTGPVIRVKADFSERMAKRRENLKGKLGEKWRQEGISQQKINHVIELMRPSGNPFIDLCILKGRFPSTRARFCSEETKHLPIRKQIVDPLLDQGFEVVSWQGVRWDESQSRAKLEPAETVDEGLHVYRPILAWTADEVFAIHKKHGITPNPLYKQGMNRVGCMPCIHCAKNELNEIAGRFPEEINRIAEWERLVGLVSKRGLSSFFAADKTPEGRADIEVMNGVFHAPLIRDVVEWSKTSRGGKQYNLLPEEQGMCSSIYGLCE